MRRLSLISDVADRELDAIRTRVDPYARVGAPGEAVAAMRELASRRKRAEIVDLIGHSQHGFLTLGRWILDDSPHTSAIVQTELRPALDAIGVHTIRLLGCATSATDGARSAMRRIERASGRVVHGTLREVGAYDYDRNGFIGVHLLADRDGPLRARPARTGLCDSSSTQVRFADVDLGPGPRLDEADLAIRLPPTVADQVVEFIDGERSWVAPGFTARRVMTVVWDRARLDILCDYEIVRAYAGAGDVVGRLFRVHDASALSAYLDEVTRPHTACPGDTQ